MVGGQFSDDEYYDEYGEDDDVEVGSDNHSQISDEVPSHFGEEIYNRDKNKSFTVLSMADIRRRQDEAISHVCSVLSLPKSHASLLLLHYNWNVSDMLERWFTDEHTVRDKIGLFVNPITITHTIPEIDDDNNSDFTCCEICFAEYHQNELWSLSCNHSFCEFCWKSYISTAINASAIGSLTLKCPGFRCGVAVTRDLIDALVSIEDKKKYDDYIVRSYVECKEQGIKWCPAPGCEYAIEFEGDGDNSSGYDVTCLCSYGFCWNCGEESHRPVDCELVKNWSMKNSVEAENIRWILKYSKPCPMCKRPIEKNQGCNHMICSEPCRHDFCWICLEPYFTHAYSCNKYEYRKQIRDEEIPKNAEIFLEKYTHYYERWASNHKSREKAIQDLQRTQSVDLEILSWKKSVMMPVSQLEFIVDAWKQIIECRRVLKWSYAYGYYLIENNPFKMHFFEHIQGLAENYLERLHSHLEISLQYFMNDKVHCLKPEIRNFKWYSSMVINLTKVTAKYFEDLVVALENGL